MVKKIEQESLLTAATDHDILIRLAAVVETNHATVLEKIGDLKTAIGEVKDGSNVTLLEHERRIRAIEKVHDEINPVQSARKLEELYQWKRDSTTTHKRDVWWGRIIAGIIGATVSGLITLLTNLGVIPIKH